VKVGFSHEEKNRLRVSENWKLRGGSDRRLEKNA
jgi:hypothetical protein